MKRAAVLLLAALFLASSFAGCRELGNRLEEVSIGDPGTPAPTASPSPAPVEIEPSQTPAPVDVNPVSVMFTDFFEAFGIVTRGIFDAIDGLDGAEEAYFSLMRDEELISRLYPSVGALTYAESKGCFDGVISGAYAGNGRLEADGSFFYRFDSGDALDGSVDDSSVTAVLTSGTENYRLELIRLTNGFLFIIGEIDEKRVCEVRDGTLSYTSLDSEHQYALSRVGFPDVSGIAVLRYSDGTARFGE